MIQETEGLFASKPKRGRRRKIEDSNWLPDGWNVEVKYRSCGKEYKVNGLSLSSIHNITLLYHFFIL